MEKKDSSSSNSGSLKRSHDESDDSVEKPSSVEVEDGNSNPSKKMKTIEDVEITDIPSTLNIKDGVRIQVQWDIANDNEGTSYTKWWSATLMPHQEGRLYKLEDENDATMVPIRTLQYDAFPEGGFHEISNEDVCFLTEHSLLNMNSMSRAYWRLEDDKDWEPTNDDNVDDDEISVGSNANATTRETALRNVLDAVLERALIQSKTLEKMEKLEASQRCFMAEKITHTKEKLVQMLMKQFNDDDSFENVITPEHIRSCMEQLGQDINL